MDECPHCDQEFFNELEVQQHIEMVHSEKWEGNSALSQSGDENAVGAVPHDHPDYVATRANRARPSAEERVERAREEDIPHDEAEARAEERNEELTDHPAER